MKTLIFLGSTKKIQLLEGGSQKPNIEGDCLKRKGLLQFANLMGGFARKKGEMFLGGWEVDITIHAMLEGYQLKC